jgi:CarD family transcriptional regulator
MMLYCPSHGPGKVVSIEEKQLLGEKCVFCKMVFQQDGFGEELNLLVPVEKMKEMGIRTIVSAKVCEKVLADVLKKRAKGSKGVWTSRIQECETKLYSGIIVFVAEVVRDLYVGMSDPTKSYGERIIFDKAFNWLVQEFSLAMNITCTEANRVITDALQENVDLSLKHDIAFEEENGNDDDFEDEDIEDEDDMKKKTA